MTRDYKFKQMGMPEMLAALDTAITQIGQQECDEGDITGVMPLMWITAVRDSLASLSAPVAADPPSLVALVQEWQAAYLAERQALATDTDRRRLEVARAALLAWTAAPEKS